MTTTQAYDPATDSWRTPAPDPLPISYLACGGVDGHIIRAARRRARTRPASAAPTSPG
ncbi:hypothetical protein OG762_01005 [Streptomyces sp. NBC_01136]|nr:hypothetical protein OG762_01005 [Streptomyces sp. NBC_01136]